MPRRAVVELDMAAFDYSADGRSPGRRALQRISQAGQPIPQAVTASTGLTDAMVKCTIIEAPAVATFVGSVDLLVRTTRPSTGCFAGVCDEFAAVRSERVFFQMGPSDCATRKGCGTFPEASIAYHVLR